MNNPLAIIVCIIFFGILFLVLYAKIRISQIKRKNLTILQSAYNDYMSAISQLKSNPTNADLKQNALALGREYSSITSEIHSGNKFVTIYDEVALMNDINAACGGAVSISSTNPTIEERLAKLSALNEKGLISQQEYKSRRQQILNEI